MKKFLAPVAIVAAAALAFSACSTPPPATPPASAPESQTSEAPKSDFLACMVSDEGGFDDKSFNQSSYEGLVLAGEELGVSVKTAESKNVNDFAPNLKAMQDQNCGLTIAVGYMLAEATKAQAEANTGSKFAIVDDNSITLPNVKSLIFKTSEAAFLAGYVSAAYSKSGIVATFGGLPIPSVTIFMDGFVDGVAQYNADSGKTVKVLGWDKEKQDGSFNGNFDDQAKGKNTTKNFIDQGADVIMPVAGPVGLGAAAAAKEAGDVAIVWVDADGYVSSPEYKDLFLTSVMKQMGASVYDTVKEAATGAFTNAPYVGTLANGGVSIAPYHDFESKVPADVQAKVEDLKAKIISGEVKVSSPSDPK